MRYDRPVTESLDGLTCRGVFPAAVRRTTFLPRGFLKFYTNDEILCSILLAGYSILHIQIYALQRVFLASQCCPMLPNSQVDLVINDR